MTRPAARPNDFAAQFMEMLTVFLTKSCGIQTAKDGLDGKINAAKSHRRLQGPLLLHDVIKNSIVEHKVRRIWGEAALVIYPKAPEPRRIEAMGLDEGSQLILARSIVQEKRIEVVGLHPGEYDGFQLSPHFSFIDSCDFPFVAQFGLIGSSSPESPLTDRQDWWGD